MVRKLRRGDDVAFAVDGPRAPSASRSAVLSAARRQRFAAPRRERIARRVGAPRRVG
jgi:hypothetical protein